MLSFVDLRKGEMLLIWATIEDIVVTGAPDEKLGDRPGGIPHEKTSPWGNVLRDSTANGDKVKGLHRSHSSQKVIVRKQKVGTRDESNTNKSE
jgi:hypothetical protein